MMSTHRLTDHVALVVGGGTGIGRAVALALSADGAALAVCGRRATPLERVVAEIEQAGGVAIAVPGDALDPAERGIVVAETVERLGAIDVLIVSTVGPPPTRNSWLEWSDDDWRAEVETGALACHTLAQLVAPGMVERRRGRIVFIGSVLGSLGVDPLLYRTESAPDGVSAVAYHAAKGAITATARALACALASDGVTVNVVSPGMIDTAGVASLLPPEVRLRIESRTPAGRLGLPEEVAAATAFLASPAAAFINGQDLIVDGGWSAW
jgi:gluconate 5-dehydrogenase